MFARSQRCVAICQRINMQIADAQAAFTDLLPQICRIREDIFRYIQSSLPSGINIACHVCVCACARMHVCAIVVTLPNAGRLPL